MSEETVVLGHGSGGLLTRDFIKQEIVTRFGDGPLAELPDGARLPACRPDLVFTCDSYVVSPLIFPGGNIGDLAVHGTVNDIAVSGGDPRWLSVGLILEEGLPLATVRTVLDSIAQSADACGVTVATGDTKVVVRGQCDGMYINTAGIGEALEGFELSARRVKPGDRILASGFLGDHGIAVMAVRKGIAIHGAPASDTAPVHNLVRAIGECAPQVRFMRDPTRGGLAAVLSEVVAGQAFGLEVDEANLPFSPGARAVAELLGLDLLHVASEGRMIAICAPEAAPEILSKWRALPEGAGAVDIGRAGEHDKGRVVLATTIGGRRLVGLPSGELLPRIC
jgi:hydrogenase expression/formation protein HypE